MPQPRPLAREKEMKNSKLRHCFFQDLGKIHQPYDAEIKVHIFDSKMHNFLHFNLSRIGLSPIINSTLKL